MWKNNYGRTVFCKVVKTGRINNSLPEVRGTHRKYITEERNRKWKTEKPEGRYIRRLKRDLQQELLQELDFSKELDEEELLEIIDEKIRIRSFKQRMWLEEKEHMRKEIFRALRRLDILQELIEDPRITEIMINGKDDIFIEQEENFTAGKMVLIRKKS